MQRDYVIDKLKELMDVLAEIFRLKGKEEEIVVLIDKTLKASKVNDAILPFGDSYHIEPKQGTGKSWLQEAEIIADMLIIRGIITNDINNYKQAYALLKYVVHMDSKTFSFPRIDKIRDIEMKILDINNNG